MTDTKYIFIDVDGTIVDHQNKNIPQNTRKTIHHLLNSGHKLFIASGRARKIIVTGVEDEFSGYICSLGTNVYYDNKEIYDDPYTDEEIAYIINKAKEYGIDLSFECKDKGYAYDKMYKRVSEAQKSKAFGDEGDDYWTDKKYPGVKVYKLMAETDISNEDNFNRFNEAISHITDVCDSSRGNLKAEEVCRKNHSKGHAIKALADMGVIDIENTIAIGDSSNDITMLKTAKIGIVMGQAEDYVKETGDIITDTISNDGFYKAFKKLGLID